MLLTLARRLVYLATYICTHFSMNLKCRYISSVWQSVRTRPRSKACGVGWGGKGVTLLIIAAHTCSIAKKTIRQLCLTLFRKIAKCLFGRWRLYGICVHIGHDFACACIELFEMRIKINLVFSNTTISWHINFRWMCLFLHRRFTAKSMQKRTQNLCIVYLRAPFSATNRSKLLIQAYS